MEQQENYKAAETNGTDGNPMQPQESKTFIAEGAAIAGGIEIQPSTEAPDVEQIKHRLLAEAAALTESHPQFDLEQALQKEDFAELMLQGLSMEQAYALSHAEELFQARLQAEKQKWEAERSAMEQRVPEAALQKTNYPSPDTMSRAQREAIAKRVARGEIISL